MLEHLDVHALDFAGEQVVHAVQDAQRMGDDGIGAGGAQVVGGEPLEDFVREAIGGREGEPERRVVGDAGTIEVRRSNRPARAANAPIWADAPWTSTTRMFSERSTAMSTSRLAKFSLVTMAPSTLMMNVFSRNCGMYCRMPRRSVSFTFVSWLLFYACNKYSVCWGFQIKYFDLVLVLANSGPGFTGWFPV